MKHFVHALSISLLILSSAMLLSAGVLVELATIGNQLLISTYFVGGLSGLLLGFFILSITRALSCKTSE